MKLIARLTKENVTVAQLLRQNHGLRGPINNWSNINGALLYYGMAYAGQPNWIGFVQTGTQTAIRNLTNQGAVGIIFIPIQRRYIVYTFGITVKKLNPLGFERDFGLKVVLNTVNPNKLKSVDSKIVDTIIVNKRTQLSKENGIEDFGFEINKDLLRAVVGKPDDSNFASLVAGSDTLGISCEVTARTIRRKSREILNAYNSTRYRRHYRWVDNIKPIKDKTTIASLEGQLVSDFNSVLNGGVNTFFQLASPELIDFDKIDHFRFRGFRSQTPFPLPEFHDLITDLLSKGISSITPANLSSYHVDPVDGNGLSHPGDPLYNWLIAEIRLGNDSFILSEGEWFRINRRFFNSIQRTFTSIISSHSEFGKIGTTTHPNETAYITNYAVSPQEKILDKGLSYIYGNNNSLEICDIYNSRRQFIHIKDSGISSKLSHLFNQGYVSALTFISDPAYQRDIRSKLNSVPMLARTIRTPIIARNYTIVFRILKKGAQFDLPFFTKVVIEEMHRKIKNLGFRFKLEWVEKI